MRAAAGHLHHLTGIDLTVKLGDGFEDRAGPGIGRHADLAERAKSSCARRPVSVAVLLPNTSSQECSVISTLLALHVSLSTLTAMV